MTDTSNYNALVGTRLEHGGEAEEPLGPGQYTSGDVDANPDGTPIFWQQAGNALVVASLTNPVPVNPPYLDAANDNVLAFAAARASGGTLLHSLIAAAGANQDATVVKASSASVYGIMVSNTVATLRYIKLYNQATSPASTDTPVMRLEIPVSANLIISFATPISFPNGLGYRLTTGIADNSAAAVTANDLLVNISYF